ncbi:MAG: hypothetical protein E7299_03535 [Lachnospiraceae bacterium]|nr:hypothetical protein [Lachnospiraceae bacterium]
MIISVAGNIASGKTTLAKNISRLYNFSYVPAKRTELTFLNDFFDNIPDNFFSTQTAFLINKVYEIDSEKRNTNLVIDRSLYEDIHVFAQLWMDEYNIHPHEKDLYKSLANYLSKTVPQPDIYIYCSCKSNTLKERFSSRKKREFEKKYPPNYIDKLYERYSHIKFPDHAVIVEINTDMLDVRNEKTVNEIMSMIFDTLTKETPEQLSLFSDTSERKETKSVINPYIKITLPANEISWSKDAFKPKKKTIYLAAPFTEFATEKVFNENSLQFSVEIDEKKDYDILPRKYQRTLTKLQKLLTFNQEVDVILPHKDENNWGKTYISSTQVVEAMLSNLLKSDLIVAIVSNSVGVHMELAMMAIQNKPMVLIIIDELTKGFYAEGFQNKENVLLLHAPKIDDVYTLLNSSSTLTFIRRNLNEEKNEE